MPSTPGTDNLRSAFCTNEEAVAVAADILQIGLFISRAEIESLPFFQVELVSAE
jgi:hypothetical protein